MDERPIPGLPGTRGCQGDDAVRSGRSIMDLVVLAALAARTPVALVSVPTGNGRWSTLAYGLANSDNLEADPLYSAVAAARGPVEFADLLTSCPRSLLLAAPNSLRWAYASAIAAEDGSTVGVIAVLDQWLRQTTRREQTALSAATGPLRTELALLRRHPPSAPPTPSPLPPSHPTPSPAPPRSKGRRPDRTQLLRTRDVAKIFDVTERTVINWTAAGRLPSIRTIGGHLRFRQDDIAPLISGDRTDPPQMPSKSREGMVLRVSADMAGG